MESENTNKPSVGKLFLLTLVIICTSFIVYYAVMSMRGPGRKLEELKKEYAVARSEKKADESKVYNDSSYLRLMKERAFLQSRVLMAGTDSIYLTINLADSSMNLEISGIVVHKARIASFEASRILKEGNENVVLAMLATPLTIASEMGTIRKEPMMIKMAPKDTSEYKPDIMPDTSITEPVFYILDMTNGSRLYVYQDEHEKRSDRIAKFRFDFADRLQTTWTALKSVAVFKVPEYHPYIKIKLSRSDARIIYRAIPKNGQIALYL